MFIVAIYFFFQITIFFEIFTLVVNLETSGHRVDIDSERSLRGENARGRSDKKILENYEL